jgi:hypothetical protein
MAIGKAEAYPVNFNWAKVIEFFFFPEMTVIEILESPTQ